MEAEGGFQILYKILVLVTKQLHVNGLLLIGVWMQEVQLGPCGLIHGNKGHMQTCATPQPHRD